jgi:hypothetical protein
LQNDAAADFLVELMEADDFILLDEALDSVLDARPFTEAQSWDIEIALAAAEVVARLRGRPSLRVSKASEAWVEAQVRADLVELAAWVARFAPQLTPALLDKARRSTALILAEPTEQDALWMSDDLRTAWRAEIADLAARLK